MKFNKLLKSCAMLCIAFTSVLLIKADVQAEYITDSVNRISYDNEQDVSVGYAYDGAKGAGCSIYISIGNTGDYITNVQSSSSNLLAKKTMQRYVKKNSTDWDYETSQAITTNTTSYSSAYISCFAKKAGTYTVSFDVMDVTGTVRCSKTIKVVADGSYQTVNAIKSLTYAGKDIYTYYPYTTKTSGRLSVKLKKGFSLVSIEVGKRSSTGNFVYTRIKNNRNIKLAKAEKYSYDSGSSYSYSSYNPMFPCTQIRVTTKNNKTKELAYSYASLYTMNKK